MNSSHSRSPEFIYIHCVLLFDFAPAKTWTKPRLKLSQPSTFLPPPPVSSALWRERLSAGCQEETMTSATAARDCLLSSCLGTLRDHFLCPLSAQGCLEAFLVIPSVPREQLPHYLWLLTCYCVRGSWSQLKSPVTSVCGALLQSSDIWTLITLLCDTL